MLSSASLADSQKSTGTIPATPHLKPSISSSLTQQLTAASTPPRRPLFEQPSSTTSAHPKGAYIFPSESFAYQSGCSNTHALSQELWLATQSIISFRP